MSRVEPASKRLLGYREHFLEKEHCPEKSIRPSRCPDRNKLTLLASPLVRIARLVYKFEG